MKQAVRMWIKKNLLVIAGLLPALAACGDTTLAINRDYNHAIVQCGILPAEQDPYTITFYQDKGIKVNLGARGIQTGVVNECSILLLSKHSTGGK